VRRPETRGPGDAPVKTGRRPVPRMRPDEPGVAQGSTPAEPYREERRRTQAPPAFWSV
jgi:hypothetical protein